MCIRDRSMLYVLEASTTIARKAGYAINNVSSGLFFQSALGIFSRLIMFVFMPTLGFLADTSQLYFSPVLLSYIFVPLAILGVYLLQVPLENLYGNIVLRLSEHGSYFKKTTIAYMPSYIFRKRNVIARPIAIAYVVAGVPYMISWAVLIMALILFQDYRGSILGLSTLFTGMYTLFNSVIIDPYLSKLGNYPNLIQVVYRHLLYLKLLTAIIAFFLYVIIYLLVLNFWL